MSAQLISHRPPARHALRCAAAAIGVFVCGWLLWGAGRTGISRLLSTNAMRAGLLIAADRAVSFAPADPEARYARAAVLLDAGEYAEAAGEFERSAALRPRDYTLWLELGQARDQAGAVEGAIKAFQEAARLAPYYAQPRWQLGNLLLREGRYDEAFVELRRAAASSPNLMPNVIDLAYGLYGGDASAIEQMVQPRTPAARLALARLFARNGKADEALRMFHAAGQTSDQDRQTLTTELLNTRHFAEAHQVWAAGRGRSERGDHAAITETIAETIAETITDSGFEDQIQTDAASADAFGWRIWSAPQGAKVSLNAVKPRNGSRSLLLEWSGDLHPSTPVVSQLILVEPKTRYRLSFWARAEELVTGGLPVITITDPGGERLFAQSEPLPQTADDWRRFNVEFETPAETQAALIAIRRQSCGAAPCPIFGRTWFDDFTLSQDRER